MKTNALYQQGDTLRARLTVKTSTALQLTTFNSTFAATKEGEGDVTVALPSLKIKSEFRVISSDIFISDWKTITSQTIPTTKVVNGDVIEVRFTLLANDNRTYKLTQLAFDGLTNYRVVDVPTIRRSIFSTVYDDPETEKLALNLFKKLYYRGIVPKYITRAENVNRDEDEDYIVLMQSIAKYFAMILRFFYRFENIYDDYDLLREWVSELGIYVNDQDVDLKQLQYISRNLYNEVNKRGTLQIFDHDGDSDSEGKLIGIDGEFIRLLRLSRQDVISAEYMQLWQSGWCVRRMSPLYTGVTEDNLLNQKAYVTTERIKVNCRIDNLIKLRLVAEGTVLNKLPEVTIRAFDENEEEIDNAFIRGNGEEVTNEFLQGQIHIINTKILEVNLIVYAYNSQAVKQDTLNIGFGNSLAFFSSRIKSIELNVTDQDGSYAYTVKPLVRGKNILPLRGKTFNDVQSWGFIQASRLFYMWTKNNNKTQSETELKNIINHYLLPYNMVNVIQMTDE